MVWSGDRELTRSGMSNKYLCLTTCLTYVWHMSHTCLIHVWNINCLTHVWHISHICLTYVWRMSDICLTHVWHMSHICLTYVWNITCLTHVWHMSDTRRTHVWERFSVWQVFLSDTCLTNFFCLTTFRTHVCNTCVRQLCHTKYLRQTNSDIKTIFLSDSVTCLIFVLIQLYLRLIGHLSTTLHKHFFFTPVTVLLTQLFSVTLIQLVKTARYLGSG